MLSFIYKRRFNFLLFIFWAIFLGIKPNVGFAGFVDSKIGLVEKREYYLEKINTFLQNEKVVTYLKRFGLDKEVILERIRNLDEERLREIALRCDVIKVGGGSGTIILILFILLLIFIVLYITNYTIKIEPRDAIPRRY